MSENLEDFIKKNRNQFDQKIPDLKVWTEIEKQLPAPKATRISLFRVMSIAASVIFLLALGAYGGKYFMSSSPLNTEPMAISLDDISTEYGQLERDFQKQIRRKRAQLASYNYDVTVNEDLTDLDKTLDELRKELIDVPKGSEEQIVDAMIKNYKTKVAILEIVLEKITATNSKRSQKDESSEM